MEARHAVDFGMDFYVIGFEGEFFSTIGEIKFFASFLDLLSSIKTLRLRVIP